VSAAVLLSGCGGSYKLSTEVPGSGGGTGGVTQITSCDQLFSVGVQPRMEYCRNCHVPGGTADVPDGKLFMLSQNKSEDFANLRTSWEALGRNDNGKSRILKMASGTDTRSHTGGSPWPVGSDAYKAMDAQLLGFVDPQACTLTIGGNQVEEFPLLGSDHGRGTREIFCEGFDGKTPQPDSAVMPQDARELVQPGISAGKAVAFNAYWENCVANLTPADQAPKTCGEFRKVRDEGKFLQTGGWAQLNGTDTMTAAAYNDTWKKWGGGLTARPANFDQMYTLRYGDNSPYFRNPYPIPKADGTLEDPNAPGVNGGSGQLPISLIQGKDANGKWTGIIQSTGTPAGCSGCHAGQVGIPGETSVAGAWWGIPNANADGLASALDKDPNATGAIVLNQLPPLAAGLFAGPRGRNDASSGFELIFFMIQDWQTTEVRPDLTKYNSAHARSWQDSPSWFHAGHQARKFKSGEVSMDAHRMSSAACGNVLPIPTDGAGTAGIEAAAFRDYCGLHLDAYHESLQSPAWPEDLSPIDTQLAEQGAILFHTKNLWAQPGNAALPKPDGNGSCAGCHGAYSPRFVHDPTYLATPALGGMASYITPMAIIKSDPGRYEETARGDSTLEANGLGTGFATAWDASWSSYPEGQPGYTGPLDAGWNPAVDAEENSYAYSISPLAPKGACQWSNMGVAGYLAPSLQGIWTTAPYLHSGSVPTIGQVLDSSKRSTIWQRKLQKIGPVTGFDQSFATGYDFENIGWKTDEIKCEDHATDPFLSCNPDPTGTTRAPLGTIAQDLLQGTLFLSGLIQSQYLVEPDLRFVYDSRHASMGNQGHEFTDVLTDQERKAIIEYLKTL
jgi:hypothetical protein